jgi:hypothetical protein
MGNKAQAEREEEKYDVIYAASACSRCWAAAAAKQPV